MSSVLSAIGMNSLGGIRPRSGWRQRMSASTPVIRLVREVVHRLVFEEQLVVIDRVPERLLGLDPAHGPRPDLLVEHRDAVATLRLGVVHRRVGFVQHRLRVDVERSGRDRQTDARGHDELATLDVERSAKVGNDRARDVDCDIVVGHVVQHDDELVAAEPGDRIDRAPSETQPPRDLDEQVVAGGVSE